MACLYEIHIRGRVGPEMLHLLDDLEPRWIGASTVLRTRDHDQAMLHGAFTRIRDLGLEIAHVDTVTTPD
jgi:hypothetical protein